MKLFRSSENKIAKDKTGEHFSYLEIIEIISVHGNVVSNSYPKRLRVSYKFVPNKSFDQFLEISLTSSIFL